MPRSRDSNRFKAQVYTIDHVFCTMYQYYLMYPILYTIYNIPFGICHISYCICYLPYALYYTIYHILYAIYKTLYIYIYIPYITCIPSSYALLCFNHVPYIYNYTIFLCFITLRVQGPNYKVSTQNHHYDS